MKVIEFFCGTKSFTKSAKSKGHETFTLDYNPKFNPDIVANLLYFNAKYLPKYWRTVDIAWFSPPCESFSLAGNSYYLGFPTSAKSYIGLALAYKCIELIQQIKPRYWIIENSRAGLRNVWFMKPLERTTVCYCQYGDDRMKPTDLWNNFGFKGKICYNGCQDHEQAPRGSKKGTQGEYSTELRGIVPPHLCEDILNHIEAIK